MTWATFLLWLLLFYVIYYALTALYDILFSKEGSDLQNEDEGELFYEDPVTPIDVSSVQKKKSHRNPEPVSIESVNADFDEAFAPVDSTGGIDISELFRMKKSEASLITNKFVFG